MRRGQARPIGRPFPKHTGRLPGALQGRVPVQSSAAGESPSSFWNQKPATCPEQWARPGSEKPFYRDDGGSRRARGEKLQSEEPPAVLEFRSSSLCGMSNPLTRWSLNVRRLTDKMHVFTRYAAIQKNEAADALGFLARVTMGSRSPSALLRVRRTQRRRQADHRAVRTSDERGTGAKVSAFWRPLQPR